jgi:hypothetical protein
MLAIGNISHQGVWKTSQTGFRSDRTIASGCDQEREQEMSNKHATQCLLISLTMAATGAVALWLMLRSAAMFWFQSVFQAAQPLLG